MDMWSAFGSDNGSLAVDAVGNIRLWMPNDNGDGKPPMELRAECNRARRAGRGNWRPVEVMIHLKTVTPNDISHTMKKETQNNTTGIRYNRPIQEAQRLGISRRELGNWMGLGIIPYIQIGRVILFNPAEVDAALAANRNPNT